MESWDQALGLAEAASLRARLMAWHDAMVAHERRMRSGHTTDVCDEDCPHVEARALWAEVSAMLGARASATDILAVACTGVRPSEQRIASARRLSSSLWIRRDPSRMATAEL